MSERRARSSWIAFTSLCAACHSSGATTGVVGDAASIESGGSSGASSSGGGGAGSGGFLAGGATSTGGEPTTGGMTAASGSGGAVGGNGGKGTGATSGGNGGATGGTSGATGGNSATGGTGATSSDAGAEPFKGVANSPCAARQALGVSWYYNWTQTENEPCPNDSGGKFVPMVWGHTGSEQSATGIANAVSSFVSNGDDYVLGFNEPDNGTQSNIAVDTAITLLPSFDNPAIRVGTPATQANSSGQTWFKSYMADVASNATLRADFIAIHWYGWNSGSCDAKASQLESYIKYAEGFPGNRPIWLTEWGCLNDSAPTASGVVDFYQGALAVFARHPRVQRYAWYPWSTNCELNASDGTLTDLGKAYASAPSTR